MLVADGVLVSLSVMAIRVVEPREGSGANCRPHSVEDTSLFLCLRVGQPINKGGNKTSPIESYSKKKRPEYWFSVPRDK